MEIIWKGAHKTNYSVGRQGLSVRAIVCHVMQGNMAGTAIWFNTERPGRESSTHYGISLQGEIHQYVRDSDTAYANGKLNKPNTGAVPWLGGPLPKPNQRTISIEFEGKHSGMKPGKVITNPWRPTVEQFDAAVELIYSKLKKFNIVPKRDTITRHADFDSVTKWFCPGPGFPMQRLIDELVKLYNADTRPVPPRPGSSLPPKPPVVQPPNPAATPRPARDLIGIHAPNARLEDIPGGAGAFWSQINAMSARWVKFLYPDHNLASVQAAKSRGLHTILRAPGEATVHTSELAGMIIDYAGVVDYIEVGNEPEHDLWNHIWYMENNANNLLEEAHARGIKLCTPGWRGQTEPPPRPADDRPWQEWPDEERKIAARVYQTYIRYDAIGVHAYGDYVLDGHAARVKRWSDVYPDKKILLTEVGIASRDLIAVPANPSRFAQSETIKAGRYADFCRQLTYIPQVECVCFFLATGGVKAWGAFNPGREQEYAETGILGYWLSDGAWHDVGRLAV